VIRAMGSSSTLRSLRRFHHRIPLMLDFARHCLQSGWEDMNKAPISC
jgi:hypothetical protein